MKTRIETLLAAYRETGNIKFYNAEISGERSESEVLK